MNSLIYRVNVGWYWKYYTAIIATESFRLLPRYCIGIFYYKNRVQHHCTCVPFRGRSRLLKRGHSQIWHHCWCGTNWDMYSHSVQSMQTLGGLNYTVWDWIFYHQLSLSIPPYYLSTIRSTRQYHPLRYILPCSSITAHQNSHFSRTTSDWNN